MKPKSAEGAMEKSGMGSTLTNFLNHVVFSTKHRRRLITAEVKDQLYPYLGGIIKGEGGIPMSIGGTADHVHILLKSTPTVSFSNLMQKILGFKSPGYIPLPLRGKDGGSLHLHRNNLINMALHLAD